MQGKLIQARYKIRYRCCKGSAFIVEDETGTAYVFDGQELCCRLDGAHAPGEIATILHRLGWRPVPPVAPYTLGELKMLLLTVPVRGCANATSVDGGPVAMLFPRNPARPA